VLTVTNTRTRSRQELVRPRGRPLTLYACGPTVYRTAHVGNLRTFLLADLVRRALTSDGVDVKAVQNITDVGHLAGDTRDEGADKLQLAAEVEGRATEEIAAFYTERYMDDADALNLQRYDAYPRATDHIDAMLDLIRRLEAADYAYDANEAVYFDVRRFPNYGALSGNRLEDLRPGHRSGHTDPDKRFHADFALWRKAGPRRGAAWDSPWGRGFPGWHIECSAMGLELLGEQIDVHLGGVDLAFPHHESEIAQSDAAVGHRVVDVWTHGAHLLSDGRKMAKSTGNVLDVTALREKGLDPLAFRLVCLQARYRTQINVTWDALAGADRSLARLRRRVGDLVRAGGDGTDEVAAAEVEARFLAAISDDLDTPTAVQLVHEVAAGDGCAQGLSPGARALLLRRCDAILGLDLGRDLDRVHSDGPPLPPGAPELMASRERARATKKWATADEFRSELSALGVDVIDTPDGPRWTLR
jgi:cysteinyl-tRNA synthetase